MSRSFNGNEMVPSTNGWNLPVIHGQQTEEDGRDFVTFPRRLSFTLVNEVLTAIYNSPGSSALNKFNACFFNLDFGLSYSSIILKNVRLQFDWLSRLEILDLLERQSSSSYIWREFVISCELLSHWYCLWQPPCTRGIVAAFFYEVPASAEVIALIERMMKPS